MLSCEGLSVARPALFYEHHYPAPPVIMLISTISSGSYHEASLARKRQDREGGQGVHARMRERVHLIHHQ